MGNKEKPKLLENLSFFNITFRFIESDKSTNIKDILSKLKLLDFKDITVDYNIDKISLIEEIIPELGFTPNLTLSSKDFEIFLSKKKITLSYPKDLSRSGRKFYRGKDKSMRIMPSYTRKSETKREPINVSDLDQVDLLIKMFLIPEILEKKIPKLNEISVIFGVELKGEPKIESMSKIIEESLLTTKKMVLEDVNFEIDEKGNKYFFSLHQSSNNILCSFIYPDSKLSIMENKLQDILIQNYNKYNELMEELKII